MQKSSCISSAPSVITRSCLLFNLQSLLKPFILSVWFTNLLLAVFSCGSAVGLLPWSQKVNHLLLHLLEKFFQLSIFQNQSLPTRLVVTEQRFIHLTLVAAERRLCRKLDFKCPTNKSYSVVGFHSTWLSILLSSTYSFFHLIVPSNSEHL